LLTASDIDGARFDDHRFVKLLASAIGAIGNVEQTIIDGVFSLGQVPIGAERVHAFAVVREPNAR